MKKILVSIYVHPEYYPPTLNALQGLSTKVDGIVVVTRNVAKLDWEYPENVEIVTSGIYMSLDDVIKQSFLSKVVSYFSYLFLFWRKMMTEKPDVILVYDPIPLFSIWLLRCFFGRKTLIWYHNHDVLESGSMRSYSITWFALKFEGNAFKLIDVFTLPTVDRLPYFPSRKPTCQYFTIKNYPSLMLGEKAYKIKEQPSNELKLLYQGVVRPGHGIEEIISALHNKIMDKNVTLTILGDINSEYRTLLEDLSIKRGVESRVNFVERISYAQLPLETRKYDIGLAIHVDNSIQYATGGAASNKIYEYAAMGLPVLLFDREEYRKHLDKYEWAHFTTLSEQSLSSCLSKIVANYTRYSVQAHIDFKEALNYENHFQGVYNIINKGNQI